MAKPRVFICSTFYDLRQVRANLERFIREIGYEPVRAEQGGIPYGKDEKLEEYAYKETDLCDIMIAIIGGRFGTSSQHQPYSISQQELKHAIDAGKQIYVFVEKTVHSEYATYLKNKDSKGIKYASVDDSRVFAFLEEVYALTCSNPIQPFEVTDEITTFLKEQWAGLFQRFLQERTRQKEYTVLENLRTTAETLNRMVSFLVEEREKGDQAISDILLSNHPVFEALRKLTRTPYRVFFTTHSEMAKWLNARMYYQVMNTEENEIDRDFEEWTKTDEQNNKLFTIRMSKGLFDDHQRLRVLTPDQWIEDWVSLEISDMIPPTEEDLPF